MDDGADVIGVLHGERPDMAADIIGGTEETTTGVIRLKALEAEGRLMFPVVAVNEANTKHMFDNRYGTGQRRSTASSAPPTSCIAGSTVCVAGYGWCGRGLAMRMKGQGADVVVLEVDPLRGPRGRHGRLPRHADGRGAPRSRHLRHRHRRHPRDPQASTSRS